MMTERIPITISVSIMLPTLSLSLAVFVTGARADEPEEGAVRGQIVFEGNTPEMSVWLEEDAGRKCCTSRVISERLVVHPESKGIKNVLVWIQGKPERYKQPQTGKAEVTVDLDGCRIKPHVVVLRTDQTIRLKSSAPCAVCIRAKTVLNPELNLRIVPDDIVGQAAEFSRAERFPVRVECSVHSWMSGYWLVLDHPFAAVSDENGQFEIDGIPPGTYSFRVWHEASGWLEKSLPVVVTAGETTQLDSLTYDINTFKESNSEEKGQSRRIESDTRKEQIQCHRGR